MIRLAILGSTRGTNMMTLIDAIKQQQLSAQIQMVMSNQADALILERARQHHLAAHFIDATGLTRETYDQKITELLKTEVIDLIVLIGYMRILSTSFVEQWENKIINIHPSLLPAFAGKMDLAVHAAVLQAGVTETGCTVHVVTADVDAGPIILQKRCRVLSTDTPASLKERVQQLEGEALIAAIKKLTSSI